MELRQYLAIVIKRWWLILPLTLISLTLFMFMSYSRALVFQSTSTWVTAFSDQVQSIDQSLYALDTVAQRERLFVTYCEVMTSNTVRERALELAGLKSLNLDFEEEYSVACNVLPQANVILLITRGPLEAVVQRLNEAVGYEGTQRANKLYNYVGLDQLDQPSVEEVSGGRSQQGLLGGMIGLVIGVGLAFLLDYLKSPTERIEMASIRHPKLGIYNERYFQQRLAEEINRARQRNRPISIALLRLTTAEDFSMLPDTVEDTLLRAAALRLQDKIRAGDIIAYLGRKTFAILLPETPGHEAERLIDMLHTEVRTHTFNVDAYIANFMPNTGIVESSGGNLDLQSMLLKANEALQVSIQTGEGSIHLIRTSAQPFALDMAAAPATPVEADINYDDNLNLPFTSTELDRLLEQGNPSRSPDNGRNGPNTASRAANVFSDEDSAV